MEQAANRSFRSESRHRACREVTMIVQQREFEPCLRICVDRAVEIPHTQT